MPKSVAIQARCKGCDRTMRPSYSSTMQAETTHCGHGLCARCYSVWRRSGKEKIPTPGPRPQGVEYSAGVLDAYIAGRRRRGIPAEGLRYAS